MSVLLLTIVLPVAYAVVGLATLRPVAGHFAYRELERKRREYGSSYQHQEEPNDWFEANLMAACVAAVWPLAAVVWLTSKHGPVVGAERAARLRQQQKRIEQLERELDLELSR